MLLQTGQACGYSLYSILLQDVSIRVLVGELISGSGRPDLENRRLVEEIKRASPARYFEPFDACRFLRQITFQIGDLYL